MNLVPVCVINCHLAHSAYLMNLNFLPSYTVKVYLALFLTWPLVASLEPNCWSIKLSSSHRSHLAAWLTFSSMVCLTNCIHSNTCEHIIFHKSNNVIFFGLSCFMFCHLFHRFGVFTNRTTLFAHYLFRGTMIFIGDL